MIKLNMPAAQYHAEDAISNSLLSAMARSPFHCWAEYINPARPAREATPAMRAGSLLHTVALEPDKLADEYIVRPPDLDARTKAGKEWMEYARETGRAIITQDQLSTAEQQLEALLALPAIATLLRAPGRMCEVSAFWTDDRTGMQCKARPDLVVERDGAIWMLDLKTATDPSPKGFAAAVARWGYHRQRAHYSAGWAAAAGNVVDRFVFAAVSSAYPYVAAAYELDEEAVFQGIDEVRDLIDRYAACKATNNWPAFGDEIQSLSLPPWAQATEEIEIEYA